MDYVRIAIESQKVFKAVICLSAHTTMLSERDNRNHRIIANSIGLMVVEGTQIYRLFAAFRSAILRFWRSRGVRRTRSIYLYVWMA